MTKEERIKGLEKERQSLIIAKIKARNDIDALIEKNITKREYEDDIELINIHMAGINNLIVIIDSRIKYLTDD